MSEQPIILLVEDSENDRVLISAALEQAGMVHSLQTACDGEQAIHYLGGIGEFSDRNRYPMPMLVMLDLNLPKKGGFEVLRWIARQPNVSYSVVVISTSNAPQDVVKAYDLGARSFLVKPGSLQELVELVFPLQRYLRHPVDSLLLQTPSIQLQNVPPALGSSPARLG